MLSISAPCAKASGPSGLQSPLCSGRVALQAACPLSGTNAETPGKARADFQPGLYGRLTNSSRNDIWPATGRGICRPLGGPGVCPAPACPCPLAHLYPCSARERREELPVLTTSAHSSAPLSSRRRAGRCCPRSGPHLHVALIEATPPISVMVPRLERRRTRCPTRFGRAREGHICAFPPQPSRACTRRCWSARRSHLGDLPFAALGFAAARQDVAR